MISEKTAPVLEIERLSISLSGKPILSDISLSVDKGDYISLVGPNGAGKTTLVKCIGSLYKNYHGNITLEGRALSDYSSKALARRLGYVPQSEGRRLPFSVEEFVMMGRYPHLSPFTTFTQKDHNATDNAIEITGISSLRRQQMNTLSGGERQMAFIAGALAQGANILLLDEPTTFLDYRHQAEVVTILRTICMETDITVIAVHHDINMAITSSSRIIALKNGRIIFNDRPLNITRSNTLEDIYETRFHRINDENRKTPFVVTELPR